MIKTFGKIQANIIISTSFYLLLQGSTALNGYKNFSENYALPFPDSISSTEFSEFNESLGSACILSNNLQTLFKLRLDKAEENSNGSLDGTSIGTTSNTSYTEVGKGKNGEFQSQIGLNIPLVARFEGTNKEAAKEILESNHFDFLTADSLQEAAFKLTKAMKEEEL